jgi:hypothetical protein
MIPGYWYHFLEYNKCMDKILTIHHDDDLSEVGIKMRLLSLNESLNISINHFPARLLSNYGYIPVGICMHGSKDDYYINKRDGKNGCLYRVYYDGINDENIFEGAIDKVLNNYVNIVFNNDTPVFNWDCNISNND